MVSKFKPTVLSTEFEKSLAESSNTNQPIIYTKAVGSSTVYSDEQLKTITFQSSQSASREQTEDINHVRYDESNNQIIIEIQLSNQSVQNDYSMSSLLIYGKYNGKEILIGVARTQQKELIPAYDAAAPIKLVFNLYIKINQNLTPVISVTEAGMATAQALQIVDSSAVHNSGSETIDGIKTFLQKMIGRITFSDRSDSSAQADRLKDGDQVIKGNLDISNDNSMIRVGNDGDIALVKKQWQGGAIVIGNGKTFKLQKSNNVKISPTDTMTDLMQVDPNGNIKATSFSGIIQPRIANTNDMNFLVDSGVYKVPYTLKNIPIAMPNGGIVEVYTYDGNVTYQILYVQGSKIWKRYKFGTTWYAWNLVADDSSVVHNMGDETVKGKKKFDQSINSDIDGVAKSYKVQSLPPTDANDIKDTGMYFFSGDHLPNNINAFYVSVMAGSNGTIKQIAYRDFDNESSIRSFTNGQWYEWQNVSSTSSTNIINSIGSNIGSIDNITFPTRILNNVVYLSGYCRVTRELKKGEIIGYMAENIRPYQDLFIFANINLDKFGILILRLKSNGEIQIDTINYNGQTGSIPRGCYLYLSSITYPKI